MPYLVLAGILTLWLPNQQLTPGVSQERNIAPGEEHSYEISLNEGDFLEVQFHQLTGSIAAVLTGPDGRELVKGDFSDFRVPAQVIAVATASGPHRLKVSTVSGTRSTARYEIRAEGVRRADERDAMRADAMVQFLSGTQLSGKQQPNALRDSGRLFEAARKEFQTAGDRRGEARAALCRAWMSYLAVESDGLESAREAVELFRQLDQRRFLPDALDIFGLSLQRAGRIPEAREALQQSVAEAQSLHLVYDEARAHNGLAIVYGSTGDSEGAINQLRQALVLCRQSGKRELESPILNNLGIAFKNLGDYRASLETYTEALTLARSTRDRNNIANELNNVGNLYRILGEYDKAVQSHQEALALARQTGNQEHEARALNTLGLTEYLLGHFQQALDYHEQSLSIRRHLHDPSALASTLDGAGRAWHRLGNDETALESLKEALQLRQSVADQYGVVESLSHLAEVEADERHLSDALSSIEAAVQLTDSLRGRVISPDLRASFVAFEEKRYELYTDVLMQLHFEHPDDGFAARALEASDRGRSRVLLESLLEARTDIRQGVDPALLEKERAYQRQLDEASTRISRLIGRGSDPKALDAARAALGKLDDEYQQLETQIRRESPKYAALMQPGSLTAAEIRAQLDPDTVLLEFKLGDTRSWLWSVSSDALHSFELPPRDQIESAAKRLTAAATARQPLEGESPAARLRRVARSDAQWQHEAIAASRMLLGAAADGLQRAWGGKRLLIAADGMLECLPFAALPDPAAPHRSLADGHEILHIPSVSVLAAIRRETGGRAPAPRTLAVLADPVFDVTDPRVSRSAPPAVPRNGSHEEPAVLDPSSMISRALRLDEGQTFRPRRLVRLPFSRREADAISTFVPAEDRLTATDFEASRALVLGGDLGQYRIVHFATHGLLNSEHPDLSGLVLSLVRPDGGAQDGFVRLTDVYNLHLTADVVVLSACQTALGKAVRGEGLVGLTRGFMYAGARDVVASLWEVDDLATAELMRAFYQGMLRDGLRPAAALRAAQRKLAAHPQWSAPYFWSAFVIQGDWK